MRIIQQKLEADKVCSDINFFVYKGKGYSYKTKVKLTKSYIETHVGNNNLPIYEYAWFEQIVKRDSSYNERMFFFNCWRKDIKGAKYSLKYASYFVIKGEDIENAIEEIIYPNEVTLTQRKKKKDTECEEVMIGWFVYIASLLFSFIFKEWFLIWMYGSFFFFLWRWVKLWGLDK